MSNRDLAVSLVRAYGFRQGAELGVWRGARAWALLEQTGLDGLLLVDPWEERFNRFPAEGAPDRMPPGLYHCTMGEPHQDQPALDLMAKTVERRAAEYGTRCRILRMAAAEAAPLVGDRSLDVLIWDAVHLYDPCRDDLLAWKPKLRAGGMLCGDGYESAGVRQAVDEVLGREKWVQGGFWGTILP